MEKTKTSNYQIAYNIYKRLNDSENYVPYNERFSKCFGSN